MSYKVRRLVTIAVLVGVFALIGIGSLKLLLAHNKVNSQRSKSCNIPSVSESQPINGEPTGVAPRNTKT